jgi:hypothetical protein
MRRLSRVPRTPPTERVLTATAADALRAVQQRLTLYVLAALAILALLTLALSAPALAKRGAGSGAAGGGRAPAKAAPWTFMVYLDGDNNLDPWGWYTLDLMAQGLAAAGQGNVRIPVLYDHQGDTGAEQGVVTAQGYVKLADVAEPDMSSPDTLARFIAWAVDGWPAQRYVLDLWDHGSGWQYLLSDDVTEDAAPDDPLAGRMSVDGLGRGIAAGEAAAHTRLDMVLFEMCNMGMVEATYELRDLCDVVVGTELTQDYEGIPWERTMAALDAQPGMGTMDLGRLMVDDLVWSYRYQNNDAKAIATLTATDQSRQAALGQACDGLSLTLMSNMKVWQGAVGSAGSVAKNQIWCGGVGGIYWFADLYVFADEVGRQIDDAQVDYWCEQVKAAVADGLCTNTSKNLVGKCYGLTVCFPPNQSAYDLVCWRPFVYHDCGLDFTADTHWDDMLRAYYVASGRR